MWLIVIITKSRNKPCYLDFAALLAHKAKSEGGRGFILHSEYKPTGDQPQLGSGMSRILKVYDKSIFNISEHFIKVEFPFSVPKDSKIIASGDEIGDDNGDEIKGLNVLRIDPAITAKKLAETINMSPRKISRIIRELREKGRIVRIGSDRKGYWEIQEK